MRTPVLVHPADGARFLHDEMLRFEWEAEPALLAPIKFDLYIGRHRDKPFEDPGAISRRWLFTPGNAWTSFNESADVLGLQPGETYYWQVVREQPGAGMTLFSDVRRFEIKPIQSVVPAGFGVRVYHPQRIRLGSSFAIDFVVTNGATETVRLHFGTRSRFAVEIYATRGILADKYLWPSPVASTQAAHHVDLHPGAALSERIEWDQTDIHGRPVTTGDYRLVARCLAHEYKTQTSRRFEIFV